MGSNIGKARAYSGYPKHYLSSHPHAPVRIVQTRRDRAEMALKTRSHEILMGEMAVLVKGYRHERARQHEVNRTLLHRLAEVEAQVPV